MNPTERAVPETGLLFFVLWSRSASGRRCLTAEQQKFVFILSI
jgi:hypothetical protein